MSTYEHEQQQQHEQQEQECEQAVQAAGQGGQRAQRAEQRLAVAREGMVGGLQCAERQWGTWERQ